MARKGAGSYPEKAGWLTSEDAEAVLAAAPALQTLDASLRCTPQAAPPLLRGEPPFSPLRATRLKLTDTVESAAETALAAMRGFHNIGIGQMLPPTPVNACIPLLASALRDSRSLTWLECEAVAVREPPEALATILASLTGHPTLRLLWLYLAASTLQSDDGGNNDALRALCMLVEANAPALLVLRLMPSMHGGGNLRDAELAPLLTGALAQNMHLRVLDCGPTSSLTEAVAAQTVPAVRAAASLRELHVGGDSLPSLREAQALLRARVQADADAAA